MQSSSHLCTQDNQQSSIQKYYQNEKFEYPQLQQCYKMKEKAKTQVRSTQKLEQLPINLQYQKHLFSDNQYQNQMQTQMNNIQEYTSNSFQNDHQLSTMASLSECKNDSYTYNQKEKQSLPTQFQQCQSLIDIPQIEENIEYGNDYQIPFFQPENNYLFNYEQQLYQQNLQIQEDYQGVENLNSNIQQLSNQKDDPYHIHGYLMDEHNFQNYKFNSHMKNYQKDDQAYFKSQQVNYPLTPKKNDMEYPKQQQQLNNFSNQVKNVQQMDFDMENNANNDLINYNTIQNYNNFNNNNIQNENNEENIFEDYQYGKENNHLNFQENQNQYYFENQQNQQKQNQSLVNQTNIQNQQVLETEQFQSDIYNELKLSKLKLDSYQQQQQQKLIKVENLSSCSPKINQNEQNSKKYLPQEYEENTGQIENNQIPNLQQQKQQQESENLQSQYTQELKKCPSIQNLKIKKNKSKSNKPSRKNSASMHFQIIKQESTNQNLSPDEFTGSISGINNLQKNDSKRLKKRSKPLSESEKRAKKNFFKNICFSFLSYIHSPEVKERIQKWLKKEGINQEQFFRKYNNKVLQVNNRKQFKNLFYYHQSNNKNSIVNSLKQKSLLRSLGIKFCQMEIIPYAQYQTKIKDFNIFIGYRHLFKEAIMNLPFEFE
ncbi:hypothetical protein PPERSA_06204 [Pseudocohnilembus persalinus]|uniref:Uncharacterized protein n=1 Tax=Pseudocohnilembus persalinus TaxID=266149 RepID=A0A0V0R169_PSEPJ|nr:hypothetical protein PPERSA_06204 [Pseudocohnilembus persalinus]|eukprot:KRX08026.1 hypothetical protein PPERSA_06204 [Pseudocohnilembus persalinus]